MKVADIVRITHVSTMELGRQPSMWAFELQKSLFGCDEAYERQPR